MAILITPFSYSPQASSLHLSSKLHNTNISSTYGYNSSTPLRSFVLCSSQQQLSPPTTQPILIDKSILSISEAKSENELWAASCLRVRTFYDFQHDTLNTEDYWVYSCVEDSQKQLPHSYRILQKYTTFEGSDTHASTFSESPSNIALTERIAGKRVGFGRVSCINATLPFSKVSNVAYDLSTSCKFSQDNVELVVVGTLDINQCIRLPDEITGMKPKGIGADFARGYVSNVCVAKEMQRNGLGCALISKGKMVAKDMGISDLYVHVAIDNEPAKKLYMKCGFVYENEEPAWQARFLDRPRRLLLWTDLSNS